MTTDSAASPQRRADAARALLRAKGELAKAAVALEEIGERNFADAAHEQSTALRVLAQSIRDGLKHAGVCTLCGLAVGHAPRCPRALVLAEEALDRDEVAPPHRHRWAAEQAPAVEHVAALVGYRCPGCQATRRGRKGVAVTCMCGSTMVEITPA